MKNLLLILIMVCVPIRALSQNSLIDRFSQPLKTISTIGDKAIPMPLTHTETGSKRSLDVSTTDFYLEVAKGNVAGHTIVTFNGHNPAVGTSLESLWHEGGLVVFPTSASTMTVSSDDANDTSAGTGARTVIIQGLDTNYLEISETVIMNGVTAVTTSNSYLRVNTMIVVTAGSGAVNAGVVYIGTGSVTSGKPAVVVNLVETGDNLSQTGFFTVPAAKDAYVVNIIFTGTGNKTAEMIIFTRLTGGLFLKVAIFDLDNGPVAMNRLVPFRKIPAKTDIELRSLAGTSADVKALVSLVVVDQ